MNPQLVASSTATTTLVDDGEVIVETTTTETHEVKKLRAVEVVVEEEVQVETQTEEDEFNAAEVAELIRSSEPIAALDLTGVGMTTDDVILIAKALEVDATVEKISFEENDINVDALMALVHVLAVNKTLRELKLGEQSVLYGIEVEKFLAETIHNNKTICVFTLNIRDEACHVQIHAALERNALAYKRRNVKTIFVEDIEQVTTTKVDKKVSKSSEEIDVTETESFVVVGDSTVGSEEVEEISDEFTSVTKNGDAVDSGAVAAAEVVSGAELDVAHAALNAECDATTGAELNATLIAERDAAANAERDAALDAERDAAVNAATNAERDAVLSAERDSALKAERDAAINAERVAAGNAAAQAESASRVITVESTEVVMEIVEPQVETGILAERVTAIEAVDAESREAALEQPVVNDAHVGATDAVAMETSQVEVVKTVSDIQVEAVEVSQVVVIETAEVNVVEIAEIQTAGVETTVVQTDVEASRVIVAEEEEEEASEQARGIGAVATEVTVVEASADAVVASVTQSSSEIVATETTEVVTTETTEVVAIETSKVVATEVVATETTEAITTKVVATETTETVSTVDRSLEIETIKPVIIENKNKSDATFLIIIFISILAAILAAVIILLLPAEIEVTEIIVSEQILVAGEVLPLLLVGGAYAFTNILLWANNDVNLPESVFPRVISLLEKTVQDQGLAFVNSTESLNSALASTTTPEKTLILCIGANDCTNDLISPETLASLGSESYHIRTTQSPSNATILAVNGRNAFETSPRAEGTMRIQPEWKHGNRGLAYGVYAALEELGFAFLHPLAPSVPSSVNVTAGIVKDEAPRWSKLRAIHYHTQHPLELTPFLQGFGPGGVEDQEGWESQVPEFASFCEWLVANKQNGVEWPLLEGHTWMDWARSDVRIDRMKRIVEVAHSYGIMVGVDVPIAFAQQHSFRLLKNGTGKKEHLGEERKEIEESLDWVMKAGFDFLGTESGTSEFTHSSPETMLAWMNAAADYAAEKYDITMFIKVHCSAGQTAPGFIDPRDGKDINFNMLPHYATKEMGVLPHTVEPYALDDPAPTYGNKDFSYIREFLNWQLQENRHPVVFYPETAYWVSVDIDVPLFTPLYFDRRLHDLRLLAADESASKSQKRMDGQLLFTSGWEWGYWLNDAMSARAAWNPFVEVESHAEAVKALLGPLVKKFENVEDQEEAGDVIVAWVQAEKELLMYGQLEGLPALESVVRKNGQGYLQGWDTWDDVSKVLGKLTQPDRLGLVEMKHADGWLSHVKDHVWKHDKSVDVEKEYVDHVKPLLEEMEKRFGELSERTEAVAKRAPAYMADLWDDIADAGKMTALRARQIVKLYEYVHDLKKGVKNHVVAKEAMDALHSAQEIVNAREKRYRVDAERIASWTHLNTPSQPTAYAFNYLWTVRSLHYWWRDAAEALVPAHSTQSASFANIIDPVEVGIGSGLMLTVAENVSEFLSAFGVAKNYFDLAEVEPHYPRDIKGWVDV
ncbi:hypothetical protein HDU98_006406 [Podochytrium sp. JEL0797]|nr:hypothetical protein HDU98_006406 [Podochytrium sp. JEL0797]